MSCATYRTEAVWLLLHKHSSASIQRVCVCVCVSESMAPD